MKHFRHFAAVAVMAVVVVGIGCSSSPNEMSADVRDNEGRLYNTAPGESIDSSKLLGKWDVDGERTNTANGNPGVLSIPADVFKDVLGAGWKIEEAGRLKVDRAGGYATGKWKLEGDKFSVLMPDRDTWTTYTARFQDGFLYLQDAAGNFKVFERSKFFGF